MSREEDSCQLDALLEQARGRLGDRKARLFACACAREVWCLLKDKRSRRAVEVAEQFADGEATSEELFTAQEDAQDAAQAAAWVVAQDAAWVVAYTAAQAAAWNGAQAAAQDAAWVAAWAAQDTAKGGLQDAAWNAALLAARQQQMRLFACISGIIPTPRFWPASARGLALAIYHDRDWSLLSLLADVLEELGEDVAASHCREPVHARGCWVVDWILEK